MPLNATLGSGGWDVTLQTSGPYATAGRRAIVVGDSIAANNFTSVAGAITYEPRGIFIHANAELGWPWDIVANGGASGERSDQIAPRIPALLGAYNPDWVLMSGCFINDIAADVSATTIKANIDTMLTHLRGRNVIWCLVMPTSLNAGTVARKAVLHECNRYLVNKQATNRNLLVVDAYSAFVNAATGNHNTSFSADNLHPNTLGASSVSRAIVRAVRQSYMGILPSPQWATACDDAANLVYNPFAEGSNAGGSGGFVAGGLTGVGPNGWEGAVHATGAGVGSKVAISDEVQSTWARIALTATAGNDGVGWIWRFNTTTTWAATTAYQLGNRRVPTVANGFIYRVVTAGTSAGTQPTWPTTVGATVTDGTVTWQCFNMPAAGDRMTASVEFAQSSYSANGMCALYVECIDGASATIYRSNCLFAQSGDTLPSYVLPSGVLEIPEFTIPATTVNVNLRVRCYGAAGVTGNFDVRRVHARLTNR